VDDTLLRDLFPAFLVFSSVCAALTLSQPIFRPLVKEEFDKRLDEGMKVSEILVFSYYIGIVRYLLPIGFIYLIGITLVVLSPFHNQLYTASYVTIITATVMWLTLTGSLVIMATLKTLALKVIQAAID